MWPEAADDGCSCDNTLDYGLVAYKFNEIEALIHEKEHARR
jgi:hypothetical protein